MYRKTLTLIAAMMLLPGALAAQDSDPANATAQARIEALMQTAAEARIPLSLLESKLEEGQAKGIALERVAAAMEARLQGLIQAREALDRAEVGAVTEGELLVAAEALRAGVSEETLIQITQDAPDERRAVATAVLTDLVRLGIGNGDAFARVNAALSGGPEALVNLRAEAAASLRARGLLSTDIRGGVGGSVDF